MSSQGVLYGTVYEEYLTFDDELAYEYDYPIELKIATGIEIALLVGLAVGVVFVGVELIM